MFSVTARRLLLPSGSRPAFRRSFSSAPHKVVFNPAGTPLEDKGYRPGAPPGELKLSTNILCTENDTTSGIWDCQKGSFEVLNRPNTESGYVLEGSCVITDLDTQQSREVGIGDSFVLQKGSNVRFDIGNHIKKFFVLSP